MTANERPLEHDAVANLLTPRPAGQMRYTGQPRGGHEICADEIDVANKRVWIITNSWGSSWGVAGRAWWPWADLGKVFADQGDATVLVP